MIDTYKAKLIVRIGEVSIETTQETGALSASFSLERIRGICEEAKELHKSIYCDDRAALKEE